MKRIHASFLKPNLMVVIWLMSMVHLLEPSQTKADTQAESFIEVTSSQREKTSHCLLEESESFDKQSSTYDSLEWLRLPHPFNSLRRVSYPHVSVYPDQSRINSYRKITSYQYYMSALNTIS